MTYSCLKCGTVPASVAHPMLTQGMTFRSCVHPLQCCPLQLPPEEHLMLCRLTMFRRTQLVGNMRKVPDYRDWDLGVDRGQDTATGICRVGIVVSGHAQGFPSELTTGKWRAAIKSWSFRHT